MGASELTEVAAMQEAALPTAIGASSPPAHHRDCLHQSVIARYGHEINAAHAKIRDLEGQIAMIGTQLTHSDSRLVRVEDQTTRNTNTLELILGRLDAFGLKYEAIAQHLSALEELVRDTNIAILSRLKAEREDATEAHVSRLREVEGITTRLIKIAGLLTVLIVIAMTMWRMALSPGLDAIINGVGP